MNSQTMTITHKAIIDRAEQDARDAMPDLPTENTLDAWESFEADVEAVDAYDVAHESADWDWVIYYHRAMELCQVVPSGVLSEAEDRLLDMGGMSESSSFGLYEMACQLAAIIVTREIADAVERIKDELVDMAQNEMDKF